MMENELLEMKLHVFLEDDKISDNGGMKLVICDDEDNIIDEYDSIFDAESFSDAMENFAEEHLKKNHIGRHRV